MTRAAILFLLFLGLAPPAAAAGEILRVANPGQPASLDPYRITGVWENRIVGDMLMGLTTEGPGGEVIGGAAESWQVSSDGLRYEFRLRDHAWSDGESVTAEDFVCSFRRTMSGATTSPYAQFFWVIENGRAVTSGEAPPEAPGCGRAWTEPGRMPANGAFRLAARVPNDHVLLEKNPQFYAADDVRLGGVRYFGLEDRDAALLRFRAGELDVLRDFPAGQTESGPNNLGGYSDAEYDRLADEASRQPEPADRAALLREAESLAMREQAPIPLYHHAARNLVSPRVSGWRDNMLDVNRSRYLGLAAD